MRCLCVFLLALMAYQTAAKSQNVEDVQVDGRIRTSGDLLSSIFSDCGDLYCVKNKVLGYLDNLLGVREESARNLKSSRIDKVILSRAGRVLRTYQFSVPLPLGFVVNYTPKSGLDLEAPRQLSDDESTYEARGLLKKKLLLPAILLLKLKLKALQPIFVALIGIKALKALILSKLAITLVVGFLVYNLVLKKAAGSITETILAFVLTKLPGTVIFPHYLVRFFWDLFFLLQSMTMPSMMMPMAPADLYGPPSSPAPPANMYGPPSNMYGAPITAAPPLNSYGSPISQGQSQSSYEPSWEPSGPGSSHYSRVWTGNSGEDVDAHNVVYSSYYSTIGSSTISPK